MWRVCGVALMIAKQCPVYGSVYLKWGFVSWGCRQIWSLFMMPSFKISGENWQNCSSWSFTVGLKPMGDVNRSVILSSNIKTSSEFQQIKHFLWQTFQTPLNNLTSKNCLTFSPLDNLTKSASVMDGNILLNNLFFEPLHFFFPFYWFVLYFIFDLGHESGLALF